MSTTDHADRLLVRVSEPEPASVSSGPATQPATACDADSVRIQVTGRLDARTVGQLRDVLQRQLAAGHGLLVLDLGDAEIGDATALALLAGAHHRARRAGQRVVLGPITDRTARLLRMAHLDRVLAVDAVPALT